MKTDLDKYLILRIPRSTAGLDHMLAVVKGAIKEAIHLNRILVIEKCTMTAIHNRGHTLENLDIERYINLDKTRIYKIENNGSIKEIDNPLRFVRARDFDNNEYPEELVLKLQNLSPVSKTQNNQYKVIIRTTVKYHYNRLVYPDVLLIALYPSNKVVHLTDIVLRTMGTSLVDTEKLSAVYRDIDFAANKDTWQHTVLDNPLHYACLHARGNDMIRFASFKQSSSSSHIRSIVKKKIPKGMRIYIMTDITKPGYLSFLKKDYTVYRYYDFPELKNLVSGDKSSVDNAMLYSVEKNIMQHAYVKLIREDAVTRAICTNSIYKIRWRYRILTFIMDKLPLSKAMKRYKARINKLIGRQTFNY